MVVVRIYNTFTFACVLFLTLVSFANALTVEVDRRQIPLNETFTLTLQSSQRGLDKVDLSPVSQQFDILSQSSQSEYSMINGKTQSVQKLILKLAPREKGLFTIPALSQGKQSSQPVQLEVTEAITPPAQLGDESIFLEATLDKQSAYVGEQVVYTLALYYRVNISNANLDELAIDNADITSLEDKSFQRQINGQTYQIVEKRYALHFREAGVHYIPGQTLSTILPQRSRSRFGFDPFVQGKEVRLAADEIAIRVQTPPVASAGSPDSSVDEWLPAEQIEIEENWSRLDQLTTGEPITRTLTLFAKGLIAESLPALPAFKHGSINSYPEKPELSNHEWHGGVAGTRKETVVYIPTQAGEFSLPAIKIRWWNTKLKQWEQAQLPSRTLSIKPAVTSGSNQSKSSQLLLPNAGLQSSDSDVADTSATTHDADKSSSGSSGDDSKHQTTIRIWQLIAAVLLVLWLYTFQRYRKISISNQSKDKQHNGNFGTVTNSLADFDDANRALMSALNANNLNQTALCLRQWRTKVETIYSAHSSLERNERLESTMNDIERASEQLNKVLYGENSSDGNDIKSSTEWPAIKLKASVEAFTKQLKEAVTIAGKATNDPRLKPLYPE